MFRNVLTKDIWDRRVSMIWWIVGMVFLGVWLAYFFPLLVESDAMQQFLTDFPPELLAAFGMDPATFLTGAGFLSAQLFSLIAPMIVIAFTITTGVAATAREERDGTMDMLLSTPVPRWTVAIQKAVSLAVLSGVIVLSLAAALIVMNPIVGLDLSIEGLVAVHLGLWMAGLVFGFAAMAAGSFTGSPSVAGGAAASFAVAAWFVNAFSGLYDWLEWPSKLSPFTWYLHDSPVINGFSSAHVWLAIAAIGLLAVSVTLFARRDIATGQAVVPHRATRTRKARTRSPRATFLLRSVFGKTLWDRRITVWVWALGLGSIALLTFAAWPALAGDSQAMANLVESIPEELLALFGLTDPSALATPEGLVSSRAYGSVGPIALIVFSIMAMASLVAREESTGRLDVVVSTPRRRTRVMAEKSAGVFFLTGVIVAVLIVIVIAGNALYDTAIPVLDMVAATVGLGLLALCFWGIAVALWSVLPGSGPAIGATAAIAVVTWFLNGLGAIFDVLAPLRWISPFYWYLGDTVPLDKGLTWGYLALAVVAVAGTAFAVTRFRTRDLAV